MNDRKQKKEVLVKQMEDLNSYFSLTPSNQAT